ncbi:unnamed protein product [Nezara viridula]|uniref:Uncharacterized protein n=1 Tax=Nezara viridula TaxID=85310 RepID=A0A9P0HII4_NEZVI|nr:unnamed protein product [Nezara viridula]
MASGDDFWEKSDVKGYNFDDDESIATQMCGVSLGGTARLSQQIKAGLGSNQKEIFDAFPVHDDTALELELSQLVPQKELDSSKPKSQRTLIEINFNNGFQDGTTLYKLWMNCTQHCYRNRMPSRWHQIANKYASSSSGSNYCLGWTMKHFALACSNPQRQLQRLKLCQRNHFQDSKDKVIVDNFIRLLEWEAASGKPSGESVSAYLDYTCRNHWDSKGSLSPLSLVQEQGVSERLFHWGWMGNKRVKTELPLERIVVQLHTLGAPVSVLMQYLDLITNTDKKLETAKKVHCHRTIIDVCYLIVIV